MPSYLPEATVDPSRLNDALGSAPSFGLGMSAAFDSGQLGHAFKDFLFARPYSEPGQTLSPEDANRDYGVDGYLTFEKPIGEDAAQRQSGAAHRRAYQDFVTRDLSPLAKIGGAAGGALLDPVGWPLYLAPELLGVRAAAESTMAARGAGVLARSGRLANTVRGTVAGGVEGTVGGAFYEGADYGLRRYQGESDYTLGDSLQNIVLGGVFGAGLGALHGAVFGHLPRPVGSLGEDSRLGATLSAIDDASADRPIDVANLVDRENAGARPGVEALRNLDEADATPSIAARPAGFQGGDEAVAVTTRGTEVPVRYAVVDMADLVTSHTDDLQPNPAFPEALQPRDRTRAGSQAGNLRLEQELNPKRLMRETGAESGAPLVAPDGTVESGNGRTIALRRSAANGTPAWQRYQAELQAQGVDTGDMAHPVLVRLRSQAMSGEGRASLTREMNADATERMGASEQAMADARRLDPATLQALDETGGSSSDFTRRFIARVAPDQQNAFTDAAGRLSPEGSRRIKAALVGYAYDDPRLVAALFEGEDSPLKAIGEALGDVAPGWAKMRQLAARGEIPPELDLTPQLGQAVDLIREARETRRPLAELADTRLGQADLFDAGRDVGVRDFLDVFFRDADYKKPRAADKVAAFLDDYSRQAQDVTPGPDLFGANDDAPRRILDHLASQFAGKEAFPSQAERVRPAQPRELVVGGLEPAEGGRPGGPGAGQDHGGGPGGPDGGPGGGPGERAALAAPKADPMANVDEELKRLAETDLAGEAPPEGKNDPAIIAEAMRAAAFCLREG